MIEDNEIKILGELMECSGAVVEKLVKAEIAMNDGDLSICQSNVKESQNLLNTMRNDIFCEVVEIFGNIDKENEYDIPSNYEIIKQFSIISKNVGSYLAGIEEPNPVSVVEAYKRNILVAINTINSLYAQLYLND